jgi:pimeloyl-ACP methyl ester carboxylesterase
VFGPKDGYPIVLAHGITCAIRVWTYQIADLAADYRVIAFDHRGHGRSGIAPRGHYSLHHLASDVDAVLEATLAPRERAILAGHSMGGIAIAAWSDRYRHKVPHRADGVALINTTTGDLLREVNFLPVPGPLAAGRVLAARRLVGMFGSFALPSAARRATREMISMLAVGTDADPAVSAFIYELFAATAPTGRGGCAKMLVDALGRRHINLAGLTVPTLAIGSERDRLTPLSPYEKANCAAPPLKARSPACATSTRSTPNSGCWAAVRRSIREHGGEPSSRQVGPAARRAPSAPRRAGDGAAADA